MHMTISSGLMMTEMRLIHLRKSMEALVAMAVLL